MTPSFMAIPLSSVVTLAVSGNICLYFTSTSAFVLEDTEASVVALTAWLKEVDPDIILSEGCIASPIRTIVDGEFRLCHNGAWLRLCTGGMQSMVNEITMATKYPQEREIKTLLVQVVKNGLCSPEALLALPKLVDLVNVRFNEHVEDMLDCGGYRPITA